MRLRTFTAATMPAAMEAVRQELGEAAVILSSVVNRQTKQVSVTAAVEEEPVGPVLTTSKSAPKPKAGGVMLELERLLRFHHVPDQLVSALMESALDHGPARNVSEVLETALTKHFRFDPLPLDTAGSRFLIMGAPGVGKTLLTAKLATHFLFHKRKVTIITTDNQRAGSIQQIMALSDMLKLSLLVAGSGRELHQMLAKVPAGEHVVIDTGGCNPFSAAEVQALKELTHGVKALPLLVLPAGLAAEETQEIAEAFAPLGARHMVMTRLDLGRRLGGLLAASKQGYMFTQAGNTPRLAAGLQALSPVLLARFLVQAKEDTYDSASEHTRRSVR